MPPQPGVAPGNRAPRVAEISGTISEDIISPKGVENGSRSTRNPNPAYQSDPFKKLRKPRKEAYSTALSEIQESPNSLFFNAFSAKRLELAHPSRERLRTSGPCGKRTSVYGIGRPPERANFFDSRSERRRVQFIGLSPRSNQSQC